MTSDIKCRRCGAETTAGSQRARFSATCEACEWRPGKQARPAVTEVRPGPHATVYLVAGDGGWWVLYGPHVDVEAEEGRDWKENTRAQRIREDEVIEGRETGERFGPGEHVAARHRASALAAEAPEVDE